MILIVDDKKENIFSLKTLLQLNRYDVDMATSGEEALKKILRNEYELIILDVQMPGMDGYEVAENITGYSKSKDIPIIFLSAVNIDKRFVSKGYSSGGVDYIAKPFDPELLLLKIKTFVRLYKQTKELNDIKLNLEQKVEARTAELMQANKELEASNAELQQYAFVASHDLQEPLRKIITFSQIVKERYAGAFDGEQYINRIVTSAERMRTLINDLLGYSKLSLTPAFVSIPLHVIVEDVVSDLELVMRETNTHLEVDDLPEVEVIADQMRQVFQNLISNAIKFSRKGTSPEVKIWSDTTNERSANARPADNGAYCRIFISDKGIGFNEQYLDKIFTMFQRLHGRAEYEGTGIGLSIVKKIVEKHDGIVTAKSKEGEGTTFILVLPFKHVPKSHSGADKPLLEV